MATGRLLTVLGVLILNFIGMIFLETKMESYAGLEIAIIIIGILLAIIALVGIAAESRWAWPFATIVFSLSLANAIFLFVNVGAIGTFLIMSLVNVFGMLVAILSIEDVSTAIAPSVAAEPMSAMPSLETYNAMEQPSNVTYKTSASKPKRSKKRKR